MAFFHNNKSEWLCFEAEWQRGGKQSEVEGGGTAKLRL